MQDHKKIFLFFLVAIAYLPNIAFATTSYTTYCWGSNGHGELNGVGGGPPLPNPTLSISPPGMTSFTTLSLGASGQWSSATCGIGDNGLPYCWGASTAGQLGGGTTASPITLPVGVTSFTAISMGGTVNNGADHACGIGDNGLPYCWGGNIAGAIGDGTIIQRNTAVAVTMPVGVTSFIAISAGGEHSCGIGNDGRAYCWGHNGNGQLGDGTTTQRLTPIAVTLPVGVTSFTTISASKDGYRTCAIGNDGHAYCWGRNNYGQLGDGTTTQRTIPTAVTLPVGVTSFTSISASNNHTCAIGDDNLAYCWGYNGSGALGDGTTTNRLTPTAVTLPPGVTAFTSVSAAHAGTSWSGSGWVTGGFTCGMGNNDRAYCWGNNSSGQLGNGNIYSPWAIDPMTTTPQLVILPASATKFFAVFAGFNHACGFTDNAPINGACGPADGTPTGSAPVAGLCNAGTPSVVSGSGPWTWDCLGINGGTNNSCMAPLPPPPPTFGGACPS